MNLFISDPGFDYRTILCIGLFLYMSTIGELSDTLCLCFKSVNFWRVLLWQFNVSSNITNKITHYAIGRIPKVIICSVYSNFTKVFHFLVNHKFLNGFIKPTTFETGVTPGLQLLKIGISGQLLLLAFHVRRRNV